MHTQRINGIRGFLTEHASEILMTSTVLTRLDYIRWTPPEIAVQVTINTKYYSTCVSTYSETPSYNANITTFEMATNK